MRPRLGFRLKMPHQLAGTDLRGTHEKTVRAQSASIYAKAGLAGRSELAAFFLEDLLVPRADLDPGLTRPAAPPASRR